MAPEICLMGLDNTSSLVTQVEGYDVNSSKFPLVKIPRFMSPVGFQRSQEGGNGARDLLGGVLSWTCTQERK